MKKICFITTIPLTLKAFVLKTAVYLHENTDWDISFICHEDDDFAKELPSYIHYYPIRMERGISFSGFKAMLEMKRIFECERFDLIQYSTPNASLYASLAGKLSKIPVRLYCQWGMAYIGFSGIKRMLFKSIEKFVCSLSTWIEPDSYSNLDFAHKQGLYPANIGSVIWNGSACGVDFNKFDISKKDFYKKDIFESAGIPSGAFVYGFVGRITRDKGINELLDSFKRVAEKKEDAYLLLVGPEEQDGTVDRELYDWSKISNRVKYTGFTNVVEQYISAMDVYILPSYREGFGMGVIEAEAMGVPVIVSNIPGPVDAMEADVTGIIVEKGNKEDLYRAMIDVFEDRETLDRYASVSRAFAFDRFEQTALFGYILEDRIRLLKQAEK